MVGLGFALIACAPKAPSPPTAPSRSTPNNGQTPASVQVTNASIPPSPVPTATAIPPTPTPLPRVVTLWTTNSSPTFIKAIDSAGKQFSGQNPKYRLSIVGGQTDYGKIIQSLTLTIGPDLFDPGALAPYATRGVLRTLDGYVSATGIQSSNYPSVMWAGGQWQGKTYGVPALDNGPELAFLVNSSLFGGSPASIDSWDKLFSFGSSATKKDGQGIAILGWDPLNGSGGLLETVESLTGQAWFDPSSNKVTLSNPVYQAYLDHLHSYYGTLGIDAIDKFRGQSPAASAPGDSGLAQNREVAVIGGYRLAGQLSDNSKLKFTASWVPAAPGTRVQRLGGHFLAIPTVAKEPDDSWQFLSYLAGDQANSVLFAEAGSCAWSNSFVSSQAWQKRSLVSFYGNSMSQATSLAGQPLSPIAGFAQGQWEAAIGAVIRNNASSSDALKAAQSAVEAELQRLAKTAKAESG